MFFREPPSSTPTTSVFVYTLKLGDVNRSWALWATSSLREAMTGGRRHALGYLPGKVGAG